MAVVLPDNFDAFARALCGSRRALRHAVKFSLMNSTAYPPPLPPSAGRNPLPF